jgi:hypothetical protein
VRRGPPLGLRRLHQDHRDRAIVAVAHDLRQQADARGAVGAV